MRNLSAIGWFVLLATGISGGQQQTNSSAPSSRSNVQPERVKVYTAGPDVTAPQLLPLNLPPFSAEKCKKKVDGKVLLSLLVDATGQPRNIMFLHPLGTDLDRFALRIAGTDRFSPGMVDGKPVVVAESVEVDIQSCVLESKDSAGKMTYSLRLRSVPMQRLGTVPQPSDEAVLAPNDSPRMENDSGSPHFYKVGGGVSAPIPLNSVEAEFTDAARRAKYQGTCGLTLIVDTHGMPQDLRVLQPLDYGLTENAIEVASRYRFKPAMKAGEPVPVTITVRVNFQLY